ncbi:MAG: 16S rRNA (adenine(1518)-N(6)/adenine(1519)-N(6))-dimethyltransferase RsmA [Bifidobacteriaceae bacterium]|nr:16S rRNA (adenine(1518)-N(6)/adenine(1519)-N(6))-dimethyltransferase RsmA [Bifidobacteriaceae bacterium]
MRRTAPGDVRLLTPADVRLLAARHGVRPTKSLGQNFMVDPGTVRRIVRMAGQLLGDDDARNPGAPIRAVEVGPGFGSLTLGLLDAGHRVTAVEVDPVLGAVLPAIAAAKAGDLSKGLTAIVGDALNVSELPGDPPDVLIANLPYNVSVPVILHFLEVFATLMAGLVLVQAEVADRLVAAPGGRVYGVPSAKLAWYASARRAGSVGRAAFWPVPRVDSALVALERRDPPVTSAPRETVFAVIDAAFSQRRKMLRSALGAWAGGTARAEALAQAAGIDPTLRAERLSVRDFARIAEADAQVAK